LKEIALLKKQNIKLKGSFIRAAFNIYDETD